MSEAISASLGLSPGTQSAQDEKDLLAKIETNPITRGLVQTYVIKLGIPQRAAKAALPKSLSAAYVHPNYLKGWRKRVNPEWDLLGNSDESDDSAFSGQTTTPPKEEQQTSVAIDEKQIALIIKALVEEKFANTKLSLDEGAKEQIRAIARIAAQATATELAKPQVIEVQDTVKGTVISVGHQHERFPTLLRAVQARDHKGHRLNIWLTGPTGSGKTSAGEAVAKALGLDFGSDGSLDADYKVLGFRDANGNIVSTEFIRIYKGGGIYIADEVDNWQPSALLALNAALANGWMTTPGGIIQRHADCCVIACANTWGLGATGDYVGRTRLDAASLDRFQPKLDWPYDEKLERSIAYQFVNGQKLGTDWCLTVQNARQRARGQGLKVIISPRATFAGIALLQAGFERQEVLDMTVGAGLSDEQKKAIGINGTAAPASAATNDSDDHLRYLISQGRKIDAIKIYRSREDCDLYTAKMAIEAMEEAA